MSDVGVLRVYEMKSLYQISPSLHYCLVSSKSYIYHHCAVVNTSPHHWNKEIRNRKVISHHIIHKIHVKTKTKQTKDKYRQQTSSKCNYFFSHTTPQNSNGLPSFVKRKKEKHNQIQPWFLCFPNSYFVCHLSNFHPFAPTNFY